MAFPNPASIVTSSGSGSSFAFSLPGSISAGDLLFLLAVNDGGEENAAVSGWTKIGDQEGANLFVKTATGSEGATDTITMDSTETVACTVARITGWSSDLNDIEVAYEAGVASPTLDPASLTPTWGSEETLWIVAGGQGNGDRTVSTWPTNYTDNQTEINTGSGGGDCTTWFATRELEASSDDPSSFTLAGNVGSSYGVYTVAIRPSAATPASPDFPFRRYYQGGLAI